MIHSSRAALDSTGQREDAPARTPRTRKGRAAGLPVGLFPLNRDGFDQAGESARSQRSKPISPKIT